jgi:fatty-acyl-CoA synthase
MTHVSLGSAQYESGRSHTGRSRAPVSRTLPDLIDEMGIRCSRIEAISFGELHFSYEQLKKHVDLAAASLLCRGLGKGDHIAIFMGNRPEWIVFWMAINRIGAVAVGISTWSSAPELAYILRHSDARMLIYCASVGNRDLAGVVASCLQDAQWSHTEAFSAALPFLRQVLRLQTSPSDIAGLVEFQQQGQVVPADILMAVGQEIRPDDVALLLYTSGSTSTPKGVQLVHRILIEHAFDIGEGEQLREGDRFWLALPLFWSAGSANTAMSVLTHGATMVLQEYFDATEAVRLLREQMCTHYFAFPNITQAIFAVLGPDQRLPAARVAVSTGHPEILAILQKMGFSLLLHPYGTTEDYGFATISGSDETFESLAWSQGHPLPGIQLRIEDPETHSEVSRGQSGEICLGGNVTPGYYKDEDKNRAAFDASGYFHTGDIGIHHPDGRLQFLGRNNEMIKTSGFNVSPAEIEVALSSVPGVAEAYAVGVPDATRGQSIVAFVRVSDRSLNEETLRKHCASALSSYKVPRAVMFVSSFPMTSTGKVSKKSLVEQALKAFERPAAQA